MFFGIGGNEGIGRVQRAAVYRDTDALLVEIFGRCIMRKVTCCAVRFPAVGISIPWGLELHLDLCSMVMVLVINQGFDLAAQ